MSRKKIIGFILIALSIGITISNINITGAVIGVSTFNSLSFIAVVFLIVGVILTLEGNDSEKRKNLAQIILSSGRYVDRTRELKQIATNMGYEIVEGFREGTRVYSGRKVLTVIPHHRRVEGTGTSRGILKALATGVSNYRGGIEGESND